MTSIKSPSTINTPSISQNESAPASSPATKPAAASASSAQAGSASDAAVAKALQQYQSIKGNLKQPMMSGAAGLFADGVNFPAELLDPSNALNDPKYLHLLSAMLGLKDMEKFFKTEEQKVSEDDQGRGGQSEDDSEEDDESE